MSRRNHKGDTRIDRRGRRFGRLRGLSHLGRSELHSALGPGFVESIYGRALGVELKEGGFQVDREKAIKIWYGPCLVGKHRLDLGVDQAVIIELKANRGIIPVHLLNCVHTYARPIILSDLS